MNRIKTFVVCLICVNVIGCQQSTQKTTSDEIRADRLSVRSDTLIPNGTHDTTVHIQDPQSALNEKPTDSARYKIREGVHHLSLQWISWDELGEAEIKYLGGNKYSIVGEQLHPDNSDYLKIQGTLEPVSAKKLIFEGTVESQVAGLNQGQPCVKKGIKIFESTKNRKYWRMQDMENCEGGRVLDYIDIYF